jgi:hypothetical protein
MTAIAASRATLSHRSSENVDYSVGVVEAEVVAVVDVSSVGMTAARYRFSQTRQFVTAFGRCPNAVGRLPKNGKFEAYAVAVL